MAILRKTNRDRYTVIDNSLFMNHELSYKAKGLLCQMLSLPDGWEFSVEGLATLSSDGVTVVRTALSELEINNYLRRNKVRGSDGRMAGIEYIVSEIPISDLPISENPISVNRPQLNTKELNTKELNTNTHTHRMTPPTVENVREYIEEHGYHVDADHFYDYYTSVGWKVGKNPMKDWKAAVRTWERKDGSNFGTSDRKRGRVSADNGRCKGTASEFQPFVSAADAFKAESD